MGNGQSGQSSNPNRSELSNRLGCRPEWNGDRHELRWRGELVKAYRKPAPHQERILAVFEEEGWPVRIDDPLPASGGCSPKQRLHSTIQALNRNRRCKAIHFGGDGTGEGIYWEVATHAAGHLHRAPG